MSREAWGCWGEVVVFLILLCLLHLLAEWVGFKELVLLVLAWIVAENTTVKFNFYGEEDRSDDATDNPR